MRLRILLALALLIGGGALAVTAVGRTAVPPPDRKAPTKPTVDPNRQPGELRPTFHFGATDNRTPGAKLKFRCAIDSPILHPCAHIYRPFSALAFGPHLMRVRALDRAGNASRVAVYKFTVGGVWDAAADFARAPNPENPGRDRYGNTTWFYLYSPPDRVHDPSAYVVMPTFWIITPGWETWVVQPFWASAVVGVNGNHILIQPGKANNRQFGGFEWRSPVAQTVRVVADIKLQPTEECYPGDVANGVVWSIDRGAEILRTGQLAPGVAAHPELTASVAAGDALYLIVGDNGDPTCDTTAVDFTVETTIP